MSKLCEQGCVALSHLRKRASRQVAGRGNHSSVQATGKKPSQRDRRFGERFIWCHVKQRQARLELPVSCSSVTPHPFVSAGALLSTPCLLPHTTLPFTYQDPAFVPPNATRTHLTSAAEQIDPIKPR